MSTPALQLTGSDESCTFNQAVDLKARLPSDLNAGLAAYSLTLLIFQHLSNDSKFRTTTIIL